MHSCTLQVVKLVPGLDELLMFELCGEHVEDVGFDVSIAQDATGADKLMKVRQHVSSVSADRNVSYLIIY